MVAGIPGTSIGGLFYILLAFLMPLKEIKVLLRGGSSWRRWGKVTHLVLNAVGILASVWATGWALTHLAHQAQISVLHAHVPEQVTHLISLTSACAALLVLGSVLVSVMVLSLFVPRRQAVPRA